MNFGYHYFWNDKMFIPPTYVELEDYDLLGDKTYSNRYYLKPGMASQLRRRHFEICLKLTHSYFNKSNVIDFGCADGCFIPSLSHYFNHVTGIDAYPPFIEIAEKLIDEMELKNVDLICNKEIKADELRSTLNMDHNYDLAFCLEVLEHVGNKENMYQSKINLLKDISSLISEDGLIIISVPKMVGLSFLAQRIGLQILNQWVEPISFKNMIKAGIFKDTSELEKNWDHLHLGFNHEKLEKKISKDYNIVKKVNDFFQVVYVVKLF